MSRLIIKNKNICTKYSVNFSFKTFLKTKKYSIWVLLLFVGANAVFIPKAKAFESPLQELFKIQAEYAQKQNSPDKNNDQNKNEKNKDRDDSNKGKSLMQEIGGKNKTPEIVDNPKQIEEAAEFASNATGVRKDFLMGMLVVESDLGRNPGKCTYQEVEDGAQKAHNKGLLGEKAWQTFLSRRDTMKSIANALGYDYEQLRVSCNPDGVYAGTGGAMGVPQFMPDMWLAYKDRIAQIVGKQNPDPWNIKDGVVAMALLVSDTPGVTDHNLLAERNAAKMYLSGTTSSQYDWYANQIFYWSHNYANLFS